jgi:predicted kinase
LKTRKIHLLFFKSLCAQHALEDMCNYLSDEGEVAIFDATNTTRERRQTIYEYCTQTFCFRVFFVESICDSLEIIDANIRVCYFKRTKKRSNQINLISSGSEIKKS